jgi:hypothetical protein
MGRSIVECELMTGTCRLYGGPTAKRLAVFQRCKMTRMGQERKPRRSAYSPNTRRVCSIRISSAVPLAALRLNCSRTRRGPRVRRAADATGSECHAFCFGAESGKDHDHNRDRTGHDREC